MNTSTVKMTRRVVWSLLAVELLLVAFYWLKILCGDPPLLNPLFDLDGEANIPAWFSSAQLLAIAFTLRMANRARPTGQTLSRWFINLLAAGFLLLSLDETAQVHETITGIIGSRYADWVPPLLSHHQVVAVLTMVGLFGVLKLFYKDARAAWRWSRRECTICLLGVSLVLLGGSGLEAIGYLYLQKGTFGYQIEVSGEEFFEMFGATLILRAALAFARDVFGCHRAAGRQNLVDTRFMPQYNRRT